MNRSTERLLIQPIPFSISIDCVDAQLNVKTILH